MKLLEWNEIKDDFTHNLLLGNGASIVFHPAFQYESLYEKSSEIGVLSSDVLQIFKSFNTKNFEQILEMLSNARLVNELLGIDEKETEESYKQVREALVTTIHNVHVQSKDIKENLIKLAKFMKRFERVASLNYDLIVYWAMLEGNDLYGKNRFKDCFILDETKTYLRFEDAFEDYLVKPHASLTKATLIFYPHGNLILGTEPFGTEVKLRHESDDPYLLDTVLNVWKLAEYSPLFVSEGDSKSKIKAIRRSNYLTNVYNQVLANFKDTLVIYGWSFGENDKHILQALDRSDIKKIAISVYAGDGKIKNRYNYIEQVIEGTKKLRKSEIYYFDSCSEGCLIY